MKKILLIVILGFGFIGCGGSSSSRDFVFESFSEYKSELWGQTQSGVKSILGKPDLVTKFGAREIDMWVYECMIYEPISEKGCSVILLFDDSSRQLGKVYPPGPNLIVTNVTKGRCSNCD